MTSHPAGPTVNGELARLEFELWAESVGKSELIGTSREEVAQEALGQIPAGRKFGPRAHLLGGSFFPNGIEQSLIGAPIGEEITKEFAPADAFGERDPKLIELFSMHEVERLPEMRREDAHLDIGTVLSIRGREGRVVTLTQARVRVDFNPPFAGRKVRGKFRFTERITEPVDQVRALIEIEYGRAQEFHVELHEHVVTVKVPDRAKFDPAWFTDKPRIVDRVRTQLHPKSIKFVEEYVTPVAEKGDADAAPPADPGAVTATASEAPPTPQPTPAATEKKASRPKPHST
ncbi:MAG: FKBP-type peptidyl-prolyl cis-trans isomerase [Thermoplasmata archaeon]